LGDFNCAIQKNLDRNPPQQLDDISVREFQSMLHRNDLFDVWRKLNPETNGHLRTSGLIPDQCDPSLSLAYFVKFTCAHSLYK
jgi:hypothetical protein